MKRESSPLLRAILEGDVHPGTVGDDLILVDRHVQFDDLGDSQVFEGLPGGLQRSFRGRFPRSLAGAHEFDDFVNAVHRSSPSLVILLSLAGSTMPHGTTLPLEQHAYS